VKSFAALYDALDRTTSTNKKVAALAAYFAATPPADAAWALFFLTGRKIKRLIPSRVLWELTRDLTGWPEWLLEHCYAAVGDFAEAMALLNDHGDAVVPVDLPLSRWITERVIPLKDMDAGQQREAMRAYWTELDVSQTFVLNRIITGEFRVGASATLAIRALAQVAGVPPATMAHRVMGDWPPTEAFFSEVLAGAPAEAVPSRPYPFFLASPLESPVESLGPREEWLAEWKWDGIRAQIVRRQGAVFLWSRGEGSWPAASRSWKPRPPICRTEWCSTEKSSPTAMACCPSRSCRRGSGARSSPRRCWRRRRPPSWPTTSSKMAARTSAHGRCRSGARSCKHASKGLHPGSWCRRRSPLRPGRSWPLSAPRRGAGTWRA